MIEPTMPHCDPDPLATQAQVKALLRAMGIPQDPVSFERAAIASIVADHWQRAVSASDQITADAIAEIAEEIRWREK